MKSAMASSTGLQTSSEFPSSLCNCLSIYLFSSVEVAENFSHHRLDSPAYMAS